MASKELSDLRNQLQLRKMRADRLREEEHERIEIANTKRWIAELDEEIAATEKRSPLVRE